MGTQFVVANREAMSVEATRSLRADVIIDARLAANSSTVSPGGQSCCRRNGTQGGSATMHLWLGGHSLSPPGHSG